MIHSWRGKQPTTAKKEENTQITKFKNNSEEIRVNGKKIGFLQAIRLQAFGGGLLSSPCPSGIGNGRKVPSESEMLMG